MENPKVREIFSHRANTQSPPAAGLSSTVATKPKLLDQVRHATRIRHYSPRTEETYVGWIKRFIFFHNKRHPAEMGETEIGRFLSSLATDSRVSASTQNGIMQIGHDGIRPTIRRPFAAVSDT